MNPRHEWEGPFTTGELSGLPWLGPLTWVSTKQGVAADRAWKEPAINALFLSRLSEPERPQDGQTSLLCPTCQQPLLTASYEGTQVFRCTFCAGTLVKSVHIPRIIARTSANNPCSARINALARAAIGQNASKLLMSAHRAPARAGAPMLSCPQCRNPMYRGFYSLSYLIETDRCSYCGLTWFDHDELEMLQCMIENRLVSPGSDADLAGQGALA
jgi:Zn-finger nucleic acid-binding protein